MKNLSILRKVLGVSTLYSVVVAVNQTRKELNEQVQLVSQEWFCLLWR